MKKKLSIFNIVIVLLFAIYLSTLLFIDYPKIIKTIILIFYFIIAVIRAVLLIKNYHKNLNVKNKFN